MSKNDYNNLFQLIKDHKKNRQNLVRLWVNLVNLYTKNLQDRKIYKNKNVACEE